jgi:hypothetical protein
MSERRQPRPLILASIDADDSLRPLAEHRFPGGVSVPVGGDAVEAVTTTNRLLHDGATLLYNAAFAYDGILAVIDILVQRRGKWYAYLQRPSTRIKEKHLTDAALHEHVLRGAGLELADISLLLLNTQYVREGALDPDALFIEMRVGRRLHSVQQLVHGRLQMLKGMAAKRARAAARAERELSGLHAAPLIPKLPVPEPSPAAPLEGPELIVDAAALRGFLEGLQYPLYFMDFEAYQVAIPEFDGHWPFRQIPFQFSVHRVDTPGGELHHEAFIAPAKGEPTGPFGEALLKATGDQGSVIVYNRDSESLILGQLIGTHPKWSEPVEALRARLVDLMDPFSRQYIRIPDIGNKLSLKFILPALLPHMNYDALVIGSGVDANRAYQAIRSSTDKAFVRDTEEALLEYCRLDTLAMVRILERIRELAKG